MSVNRLLTLLAALAVSSPLAAMTLPECAPGPHCPMAAAMGEEAPCSDAVMQEDDCCVTAPATEPAEALPVVAAGADWIDDGVPAPSSERAEEQTTGRADALSPPLYRLFRALLI